MVQAPMWNIGYMHTVAPRGSSSAGVRVRSQLHRWDSTTPFDFPVLPLVKNTTWESVSPTPDGACAAGEAEWASATKSSPGPIPPNRTSGTPTASATPWPASA